VETSGNPLLDIHQGISGLGPLFFQWTKLIFIKKITSLNIFFAKGIFLTNLGKSDIREVLQQLDTHKVKNHILNKNLLSYIKVQ
jgi:hypothetical protein